MASDELVSGRKLGRFTLVRRIALGGMAEIWLATDPEEDARRQNQSGGMRAAPTASDPDRLAPFTGPGEGPPLIALKILLPSFAKDPTFQGMFLDEVNIVSRLAHENIVQIHGAYEIEGHLVQAMELVDGKDLRRVLSSVARAGQRVPVPFALVVAREISRALGYAHMKKTEDGKPLDIVHRDVSPHNVMITREGNVKLLDFGIARAAERLTRTRTGVIKGKVAYMSPEQALGLSVTYRTDIFAAGIVLWEMLAMQRLFKAESDAMIVERVTKAEVPPIRNYNPDVPAEVATLLEQMLAQRAPMRPESMKVVENALTRILLRHYKEEESTRQALAEWVGPHLVSERTREAMPPLAPVAEEVREQAGGVDQTIAMKATDPLGASGSHPVITGADAQSEGDNTMPDAAVAAHPPVEAMADATIKVGAPSQSQVGIPTAPVRTRDIINQQRITEPTPATPTPVASTPTPDTPQARDERDPQQRFRLPTKSEIFRAVDGVKTIPLAAFPEALDPKVLDPKTAPKIIEPKDRGLAAPPVPGAASTPVTPIDPASTKARAPAASASDTTLLGDLSQPTEPPKIGSTDPTWTENPSGEHGFAPVPIVIPDRTSGSVPVTAERENTPALVTPAAPDKPSAFLYQIMLALAVVVIVLLAVLLFMKD